MEEVWGEGEHMQCVHPVSLCVAGRENVRPLRALCWTYAGDCELAPFSPSFLT